MTLTMPVSAGQREIGGSSELLSLPVYLTCSRQMRDPVSKLKVDKVLRNDTKASTHMHTGSRQAHTVTHSEVL